MQPTSPRNTFPAARLAIGMIALLAVVVAGACERSTDAPADLLLLDGEILTMGSPAVVEALAIGGDRVVATGSSEEVRRLAGPATRVINLAGRTVIPGLTDNHYHGIGGGPGVDLSGARSLQDLIDRVAADARQTPAGEVIVTNSDWHEGQLAEQRLPYRDDLDLAAPEHPVVVVRGGHQYVLNSAALAHWRIDESTPDVPGGRIGRGPEGRLNGELVDRAKGLVTPSRPPPTRPPSSTTWPTSTPG